MGDLPTDLPAHLVKTVLRGLLYMQSDWLAKKAKWPQCICSAYGVFATALRDDGTPLSESCLRELIPSWVLEWALAKKWINLDKPTNEVQPGSPTDLLRGRSATVGTPRDTR